jgi:hypothetical protein
MGIDPLQRDADDNVQKGPVRVEGQVRGLSALLAEDSYGLDVVIRSDLPGALTPPMGSRPSPLCCSPDSS